MVIHFTTLIKQEVWRINRPSLFRDEYLKTHGGMEVKLHIFFTSTAEEEGSLFFPKPAHNLIFST